MTFLFFLSIVLPTMTQAACPKLEPIKLEMDIVATKIANAESTPEMDVALAMDEMISLQMDYEDELHECYQATL